MQLAAAAAPPPAEPEGFPLHAMRMKDFLALEKLRPHNALKKEGLVVALDFDGAHKDAKLNFVSHQWLAYAEADPNADHLRTMQDVFRRVLAGLWRDLTALDERVADLVDRDLGEPFPCVLVPFRASLRAISRDDPHGTVDGCQAQYTPVYVLSFGGRDVRAGQAEDLESIGWAYAFEVGQQLFRAVPPPGGVIGGFGEGDPGEDAHGEAIKSDERLLDETDIGLGKPISERQDRDDPAMRLRCRCRGGEERQGEKNRAHGGSDAGDSKPG